MKAAKKITTNILVLSLTACLASTAVAAGGGHSYSEYLGRQASLQEESEVIAADLEIQKQPVVIRSGGSSESKYYSEYTGGYTTRSKETRAMEKDRVKMAKPFVLQASSKGSCQRRVYSEYEGKYICR